MICREISADSAYALEQAINEQIKRYDVIDFQVVYKAGDEEQYINRWYAFLKIKSFYRISDELKHKGE